MEKIENKNAKKRKKTSSTGRKIIAMVISFVLVVGVLSVGFVSSSIASVNYSRSLENVYKRSFYELVQNVNNLEVDLSKAIITTDKQAGEKLFYSLWQQSDRVSSNISRLPLNHFSIKETTNFVNKLGGFSYYLMVKCGEGADFTVADKSSLEELHEVCVYIQKILNDYALKLEDDYSILKDVNDDFDNSNISNVFEDMQDPSIKYPTLIYDGPFSESVLNKEVKGLSTREVTEAEARSIILEKFKDFNIKNVTYLGLINAEFEVYNYEIQTKSGKKIFANITKRDGFLLAFSSYASTDKDILSLNKCYEKAETFAKSIGLKNMKSVWGTKINNIAYINLTPIENDAVIYPDMIKVKVSTDNGDIIGWEARSYAYNHNTRKIENAKISVEEAKEKLSSMLNVDTVRLALIPLEYKQDVLAYEFKCTLNNYIYYVYINAETGIQENILRVIDTVDGELLQ